MRMLPPISPNRAEHPFVASLVFQGIPIDIEQRKGDTREGVDKDGTPWSVRMHAHYGEIRSHARGASGTLGAKGMDGDRLDVYVGPDESSDRVIVVDQRLPETGEFDEQKVMLGFPSVKDALECYRAQYTKPGFYGGHAVMSVDEFKRRIASRGQSGRALQKANHDIAVTTGKPPAEEWTAIFRRIGIPVRMEYAPSVRGISKAQGAHLRRIGSSSRSDARGVHERGLASGHGRAADDGRGTSSLASGERQTDRRLSRNACTLRTQGHTMSTHTFLRSLADAARIRKGHTLSPAEHDERVKAGKASAEKRRRHDPDEIKAHSYRIVAVNDEHHVCSVCGKSELGKVAWMEPLGPDGDSLGEPFHCGTTCASKLLKVGTAKAKALIDRAAGIQAAKARDVDERKNWVRHTAATVLMAPSLTGKPGRDFSELPQAAKDSLKNEHDQEAKYRSATPFNEWLANRVAAISANPAGRGGIGTLAARYREMALPKLKEKMTFPQWLEHTATTGEWWPGHVTDEVERAWAKRDENERNEKRIAKMRKGAGVNTPEDEAAWTRAKEIVDREHGGHEDKWALVQHIYQQIKGGGVAKAGEAVIFITTMAQNPVALALLALLRHTQTLADTAQHFHWNVKGPHFHSLHEMFGEFYEQANDATDDIAERVRALGVDIPAPPVVAIDDGPAPMMVATLAAMHETCGRLCREAAKAAEADGDQATIDLVGKRQRECDKAAWMLRSTLGQQPSPGQIVKAMSRAARNGAIR